jgi:hypothetical protein
MFHTNRKFLYQKNNYQLLKNSLTLDMLPDIITLTDARKGKELQKHMLKNLIKIFIHYYMSHNENLQVLNHE